MPKPYLLRRSSGLYASFLVPVDLRGLVGSRFILRPLRAAGPDLARLTAARMAVALSHAFARMRQGIVVDWKKALQAAADGTINEWSGISPCPTG